MSTFGGTHVIRADLDPYASAQMAARARGEQDIAVWPGIEAGTGVRTVDQRGTLARLLAAPPPWRSHV